MTARNIPALLCIATVVTSAVFLGYSASLYFDVYSLSRRTQVSLETFSVRSQDNGTVVETTFEIQNPSRLPLKVAYVDQVVYGDPNFNVRLGMSFLRLWQSKDGYVVVVPPFSNGTVILQTPLEGIQKNPGDDLFLIVHLTVKEVPLTGYFGLTEYFTLGG